MFARPLGPDGAELRPLEPWHAEEFFAHVERGRDFIGQHIGFADAAGDLDSARGLLRSYADKAAADTGRIFGIWLDDLLVGGVLVRVAEIPQGRAEIGCWLEPAAVGKGLVTRAAKVLVDHLVRERGVHRVEWRVSSRNAPSIAVARRLGMSKDGVLRSYSQHRGVRQDVEVWSVLAPEWES
ncbi:Protein N-acetyltransferase, RimJ/RimL family [Lentzea xinjiangensis]|uniref:Protein N-acetyltransferase, RimJ/RimL family n=1 Tax=Lentzea xinjiangensis TaxID=402600 RepID=A0A1H9PP62_9PSEU|nr:GNAT family protein [Lentzea xinjiangensis]SER50051.1 Protein N-acetyltransferase, RimJ/RimL family [Lentzea xinjiangensis]